MSFDIKAVLSSMASAAGTVVKDDLPKVRQCIKRALDEEKDFLAKLADARLAGVIDDDTLAQQLRDEARTLELSLLVCQVLSKRIAQDAANAAIDAFNTAITTALKPLIGGARAKGKSKATAAAIPAEARRLMVRKDTVDFRDLMYVPTLVEVGVRIPLSEYRRHRVPILDQGEEGACTGFGLATVAHYLLRRRALVPDSRRVSARMFYAMARRYDEWPGEDYEGSSCRGAMKGWHKHGVCNETLWRHDPAHPDYVLTEQRSVDAHHRPLGAYFRVNHKDLVAMHAAITEVGVLYASATVHDGWDKVRKDGSIPFGDGQKPLGGHAFAIVAYDERGYWIQNSWGAGWGMGGFARISYEDWMQHGSDVWVARLGVPIVPSAQRAVTTTAFSVSSKAKSYAYDDVRPHVVCLGNDGRLRPSGNVGTTPAHVKQIIHQDIPRVTAGWKTRRIVLYAHGGLVSEDAAVQRVADYRKKMLDAECYPIAFIWRTDYWTTLTNMLAEALRLRKPEGVIDAAKDFMLDRLDDALEPIARKLTGKAAWDEMKENALHATQSAQGGARLVADELAALAQGHKVEIHVVAHSAGSILQGALVEYLTTTAGLPIESCTLWAPACTMRHFDRFYAPALANGLMKRLALYTLTDEAEQDDHCAHIYNKSLLYLVSNAFEDRARIPVFRPDGEPILGMAKFVDEARATSPLGKLLKAGTVERVRAPNAEPIGSVGASANRSHGGFDDDEATVKGTLARLRGVAVLKDGTPFEFQAGSRRIRSQRLSLDAADAGARRVLA